VDAKANNGVTALMLAANEGHLESVRALLDAGADVNEKDINDYGALKLAEEQGHTEIAELLRKAEAQE